jgi:hypothetical protein
MKGREEKGRKEGRKKERNWDKVHTCFLATIKKKKQ